MKYRKKPVIIEAIQFTGRSSFNKMVDVWKNPFCKVSMLPIPGAGQIETFEIMTLEGTHLVNKNDFVIKGVKGEFYPCKPDIFAMTYETVNT